MENLQTYLSQEMPKIVQQIDEKNTLLAKLKSQGLTTQKAIDKYVSNKAWLREILYADTVIAFGDTELVYDEFKKVWNLDVGTANVFKGNPHAMEWFLKNYPGRVLEEMGKGEQARASLKYVPELLKQFPVSEDIVLKGSTISTETAENLGKKTTGAKKKALYQKLWGDIPGMQTLDDGSLMYSPRTINAITEPSITKNLGKNIGTKDLYRGATLLGIPLTGVLGTGVKAATRLASTLPGEYATFGLWKGLDVAVANWSRQDYEEAKRQYELDPSTEKKENLDFATRSLAFDAGSVVDPTPTSDIVGIGNLLTHPGIKRALGIDKQPETESTYKSEWRYD